MENNMYRVLIRFDLENEQYCAAAPELNLQVHAPSREEALAELDTAVADLLAQVENAPEPKDAIEVEGKLEVELSASLLRELTFYANLEGISPALLAQELLVEALGRRTGAYHGQGQGGGRRRDRGGPRPDKRGVNRERYHDIMENKASFLEYVRGLENGRPPRK